jgi:hypothetical protein
MFMWVYVTNNETNSAVEFKILTVGKALGLG